MSGPITKVGTKIAAINLDISRKLNWGNGLALQLLVVDRDQLGGWRTLVTVLKGFDRVSQSEQTSGDGSEVIIEVADPSYTLGDLLRSKDLHIRVDGQLYGVSKVAPVAPNEAQVYSLMCKVRTLKTPFDTTKGS